MTAVSEFSLLFRKYVDGNASPEEKLEFLALADREEMHGELATLIDAELKLKEVTFSLEKHERDEILSNIYEAAIPVPVKRANLWLRIAVAASIVMAMATGLWFYTFKPAIINQDIQTISQHDVAPGRNTATLTLADGKVINLSDAKTGVVIAASKLAYNDGTSILSSNSDTKQSFLTASTPRGGTYQVILPDGTKVWLNADSKISFPSQFSGTERKITLSGEAYFEVAKAYTSLQGRKTRQPFIVITNNQEVEVLGTHFNINSYADEASTKTTLLEGAVKVSDRAQARGEVILKPGQQSINNGTSIKVVAAEAADAIAWKDGMFRFSEESLESIMRKLSRWYNVDVVFEDESLKSDPYVGVITRFTTVSKVLKMLEVTGDVHFKIEGRKVIVTK